MLSYVFPLDFRCYGSCECECTVLEHGSTDGRGGAQHGSLGHACTQARLHMRHVKCNHDTTTMAAAGFMLVRGRGGVFGRNVVDHFLLMAVL